MAATPTSIPADSTTLSCTDSKTNEVSALDEFQLDIWRGRIPIEVCLHETAMGCMITPDPVCLLVSRMGHLPQATQHIIEYFKSLAIEYASEAWFEADEIPLKCHLPIGVLYDLYGRHRPNHHKPWRLTLCISHISPTAHSLPDSSLETTSPLLSEKLFFHSLKQALQLLHGSTSAFNMLHIDKQAILWNTPNVSSSSSNWTTFHSIRQELLPTTFTSAHMKQIPIKFIFFSSEKQQYIVRQKACKLNESTDQMSQLSLKSILTEHATLFPSPPTSVIIQGIVISQEDVEWEANLVDIWRYFCHSDLFLYIILPQNV